MQLLLCVDYLQKKSIIHRDLKPENILLSFKDDKQRPDAYLADFGFALPILDATLIKNIYGTPGYVAPEVLSAQPYTFKSDVFSLGVIFFNMISGKQLFTGRTAQQALVKNIKCEVQEDIQNLKCSEQLKELLINMLLKNPEQRYFAC